jgi:hypothetical protein
MKNHLLNGEEIPKLTILTLAQFSSLERSVTYGGLFLKSRKGADRVLQQVQWQ